MIMCDCGKREMTMEEENIKLRERCATLEEHLDYLQKQNNELNEKIILLPDTPIECAMFLISARFDYETNSLQRAFGAGEKEWLNLYSVSELRQIAEHLLVYCNHNEDTEVE